MLRPVLPTRIAASYFRGSKAMLCSIHVKPSAAFFHHTPILSGRFEASTRPLGAVTVPNCIRYFSSVPSATLAKEMFQEVESMMMEGKSVAALSKCEKELLPLLATMPGTELKSDVLLYVADINSSIGKPDLAVPAYEEAWSLQSKLLDSTDVRLGVTMLNWGKSLTDLSRFEEAVEKLEKGDGIFKSHFGTSHRARLTGLSNAIAAYNGLGREADAKAAQEEARRIEKETESSSSE